MFEFDLSVYYPIPMLTADGYVTLIKTLIEVAPKDPPPHIVSAIKGLGGALSEARSGLAGRIDETPGTGIERAFDILVDRVWMALRDRLLFYEIYLLDGAAKFTDEDREELDFDDKLDQARVAGMLLTRLFSDNGEFLQLPFAQQAAQMGARLDWMEEKALLGQLPELVGKDLALLLQICQRRYEEMVTERGSRSGKSLADLRVIRHTLRRQIYSYCGAIGTLIEYGNPNPVIRAVVENALRPILISRAYARRRARDSGSALEEGLEGVEAELGNEAELGSEAQLGEGEPEPQADP